jgi:small subunit ribosomal protein S4
MSRYCGPRLRIVRRLGKLPGLTRKFSPKKNSPGQHGKPILKMKKKLSQFNVRLREKQKLRYNYGINEKQLLNYVKKSRKSKGSSGEILLKLLEMRLDTIVFRLGMAPTIVAARQLVNHGHIQVNAQLVDIPSYECQPKDQIKVKSATSSRNLVKSYLRSVNTSSLPRHLNLNRRDFYGNVKSIIQRRSIGLRIDELLVVEYYSRKV